VDFYYKKVDPSSDKNNIETLDGLINPLEFLAANEPQKKGLLRLIASRTSKIVVLLALVLLLGGGFGGWTLIKAHGDSNSLASESNQTATDKVTVIIPGKNQVLTINSKLNVSNNSSLAGNLSVGGNTTLGGLIVNGDAILNGGLIVAKTGDFDGTVTASNITAGTINGNFVGSYNGNGANLTSVNAASLNGEPSTYYQNASNVTSGTLSDSHLSDNVALEDQSNDFTESNIFSSGVTIQGSLSGQSATFSGAISATSIYQNGYQVCDTSGNCGQGSFNGTGTAGTIPVFTGTSSFGNSILSQSSNTVTVTGIVVATALQGDGSALTNLNATNLATGTIAGNLLSGAYTGISGVGSLASGSISSGFGSISTANSLTHVHFTSPPLNGALAPLKRVAA
jgi:hypothetical protein